MKNDCPCTFIVSTDILVSNGLVAFNYHQNMITKSAFGALFFLPLWNVSFIIIFCIDISARINSSDTIFNLNFFANDAAFKLKLNPFIIVRLSLLKKFLSKVAQCVLLLRQWIEVVVLQDLPLFCCFFPWTRKFAPSHNSLHPGV